MAESMETQMFGKLKSWGLAAFCVCAAFVSQNSPARAGLLGVAGGYNEFVLGDSTRTNVDAQGAVAVGGNAMFTNFSTGSGFTNASLPPGLTTLGNGGSTGLVVGGNLTNTSGTMTGNAYVGGLANISNPTVQGSLNVVGNVTLGNGSVQGGVIYGGTYSGPSYITHAAGSTTLPVKFAAESTFLKGLSDNLAALSGTSVTGTQLTFNAASSGQNIFKVTAAALSAANSITVNVGAGFAGATILIDVIGTGSSAASLSGGFTLNGTGSDHVLMNFSGISTLTINTIGVKSSILAPYVAVNFAGGHIDGTLVAGSLTGSGESHYFPGGGTSGTPTTFTGNITIPAVPEPSTYLAGLSAIGLSLAAGRLRRGRPRPMI